MDFWSCSYEGKKLSEPEIDKIIFYFLQPPAMSSIQGNLDVYINSNKINPIGAGGLIIKLLIKLKLKLESSINHQQSIVRLKVVFMKVNVLLS